MGNDQPQHSAFYEADTPFQALFPLPPCPQLDTLTLNICSHCFIIFNDISLKGVSLTFFLPHNFN